MPEKKLKSRIALITGASDGIGKSVAIKFSLEGAHTILLSKNKKKLIVTISCGTRDVVKTLIEHLGYKVMALDRVEFSALKKGPLSRGKCRLLTAKEVGFLKMIKGSS